MKTKLTAALLMNTLLLASPALPRTLDRKTVVERALAQNPQLAAARAEEAAVAAQAEQVKAARWPLVTLTTGVGPSLKADLVTGSTVRSVQEQYRGLQASDLSVMVMGNLTVLQPLYTFGKIAWRGQAAEHGLRARQAQTRMKAADVAFESARIYEGYLLARDAERFFDETLHWLDSTKQATEDKLSRQVRGVSERDVLRLQTALSLATLGRHQAQAGKAQARAGLVAYLALPANEELTVADDELLPVGSAPSEYAAVAALARQHRPELTALNEGKLALGALARAEAAGWAPDLFLLGFVDAVVTPGRDWVQTRFVVDPLNHFAPGALLGLRWQLQGKMAGARAQEQRAQAEALASLERWAQLGIPAEVRQAHEDLQRARRDITEGDEALARAKKWMVQASADYSVGLLDARELSDAVSAYVTLRMALLQARFSHNVAMAALARATGTFDDSRPLFYLASPAGGSKE